MILARPILVIVILASLLAGCNRAGQRDLPAARPGDLVWTLAGISDVPTLDPALATDPASLAVCPLIYGGLVRLNAHLHVVPDGARAWHISADKLRYTFDLRRRLRFADGRDVTGWRVVASLSRTLGSESTSGVIRRYLADVAYRRGQPAIEALNRYTVQIRLQRPSAQFLSELAFPGADIVDTTIVNAYGPLWTQHDAGFGPYRLVSWIHGQSLVLAPNRYFRPLSRIRRLTVLFSSDRDAISSFAGGSTNLVSELTPNRRLRNQFDGLAHIAPVLALDYIVLNTRRDPLTRVRVRRALSLAVDRSALTNDVFGGTAMPVATLIPPALLPHAVKVRTNATRARLNLSAAGYPLGQKLRPLRYLYPESPMETKRALLLQTQLRRVLDVKLDLIGLPQAQYVAQLEAHDFDLALVRWGAEYADPSDFLATQLTSRAPNNLSGWSSIRFDRLMDGAASAVPGSGARQVDFNRAEAVAVHRAVWIPLDSPLQMALIQSGVDGLRLTPAGLFGWFRLTVGAQ